MQQSRDVKTRLDKLLVERRIVASRERAQAMVLAGRVLVNEQKMDKPGSMIEEANSIRILGEELRYVSRGGLKLERALDHWGIALDGCICMDVGTSTGGFVDCMLQRGAARVIAVDTGRGQIAAKLRTDARVRLLENYNARYLKREDVNEPISFLCMDVSFISATLVLPAVVRALRDSLRESIVLVKPQFEVGRERVGKGGIVRDPAAHHAAVERVRACCLELNAIKLEMIDSPITGIEGNREFLLYVRFQ